MRRAVLSVAFLLAAGLLASCKYDVHRFFFREPTIDDRAASLRVVAGPGLRPGEGIRLAILADLHFGGGEGRAQEQAVQSLASSGPLDFLVLLGDVVESGFDEYFRQCEDFVGRVRGALSLPHLPVYVVLGNHDVYRSGLARWERLDFAWNCGATFFRFQTDVSKDGESRSRSWYFLDTAGGVVGASQLEALSEAMAADPNPKIVLTHYPMYMDRAFSTFSTLSNPRERASLISLFDRSAVDMVFSGHWHTDASFDYGSFYEICFSSFVENSGGESSWYVLTLDEGAGRLEVERFTVRDGGVLSIGSRTYVLEGGR